MIKLKMVGALSSDLEGALCSGQVGALSSDLEGAVWLKFPTKWENGLSLICWKWCGLKFYKN